MCGSQEEAEFNDFPLKFTSNMLYVLILLLVGHDNENLAAADVLHKATLSVDPPTGVVVRGEGVSFTCGSSIRGVRCELFKEKFPVYYRYAPKDSFYCKFVIEKAEITDTANYHCRYRVQLDGVWRDSMQSDPVQLTVVEVPSKPTLSVEPPTGVVVRGEGVSFICSSRSPGLRHELFKDQKRTDYRDTPNESYNVTFVIPNARSKGTAIYQCSCGKFINGDWRYSARSDPVQLTVVDQLPKPIISMDPTSGVVTVGESVTITCTGLTRYDGDSYYLYSEVGANQIDQRNVAASERSVTFTIATVSTSDTGNYTCSYQTSIDRKPEMSPSSNSVQITVEGQYLTVALIRLCLSALLLIAMVIIVVEHFVNAKSSIERKALDKRGSPNRHNNQSMMDITLE